MRRIGVWMAALVAAMVFASLTGNVVAEEPQPYQESTRMDGYLACGAATPLFSIAACALTGGTPVDTFDRFLFDFTVSPGVQEVVIGMEWDATSPAGQQLSLLVEDEGCGFTECAYEYAQVEGASPIIVTLNDETIEDPDFLFSNVTEDRGIQMRVFAAGDLTVILDQTFTIFVHEFYHQDAPDGFDPFA